MLFSALADTLAKNYSGIQYESPNDCDLNAVAAYKAEESLPDSACLYVFSPMELDRMNIFPPSFLYFGKPEDDLLERIRASASNYILVPPEAAMDVFSYLMRISENLAKQQKLYSDLMFMLFNGADLTSVFCEFTKGTGFQVLAIDVSGKVVAHSKPFVINHARWMSSVNQGYLDEYLVDFIHRRRIEGNMSMSTVPFIRYCNIIKINVKGIRVIANGELIGYVFIGANEGPFPLDSDRVLQAFSKALEALLVGGKDMNSFHISMHQNILSDLLDGASEEETIQRIRSANLRFPKYMRAIVIKNSFYRGSSYLYSTLLPLLSAILPSTSKFIKNGSVVALLEVLPSGEFQTDLYDQLKDLAKEQALRIGISNMFTQLSTFSIHYNQALQAQEFAKRGSEMYGLFFFTDYAFFIMLNDMDNKEMLRQVRMPVLEAIEKYDTEKKSELYETLRIYAQTGFNKNKTAEILFLHRNTVNYRITQLEDLFSIDFSDPTILFRLQYSFYVDLYLKHRYGDILVKR